jgi:hypothetical protein
MDRPCLGPYPAAAARDDRLWGCDLACRHHAGWANEACQLVCSLRILVFRTLVPVLPSPLRG